ncbi:MAG TPA: class I adenylate-forming enzyme family protein [Acidimicrobiia bacterium]|nr:class I adenylate-forming enzyme family protein [Acidimicrobiia bacterium]
MARLKPTLKHARERHYKRHGGAWDVPSLDVILTDAGPHPELIVDSVLRLGSAEVNERVGRLAGGLMASGVRRGDAVAWQAPNWHEVVLLYRACWRLGAVAVPIHHRAGDGEIDDMLAQVAPAVILGASSLPLAARDGAVVIRGPADGFDELMNARPVLESAARPADIACVLFTSGSTGGPKGVMHTHRGLASKALLMRDVHGLRSDDAILMPAPLAHISGLLNAVVNPGAVPMKTVLMDQWSPEAALDLVEAEQITFMIGPPTFFVEMMRSSDFKTERVDSVRLLSCGGAGVTPSFVDAARREFGAVVKRTYGSTEAPTVTTSHAGDDAGRAQDTDGRATGDVELLVVDPETLEACPPGTAGELWVRGPEMFVGYLDKDATRAAHAKDGWFRTGDIATVAPDGWLTIVGRLKDVIIRKGENISASEVEAALEAHPAIDQAVALGIPDDVVGERVAAFVVASEPFDLAACQAWFTERGMASYKTPEVVVRLDEMPTLAAGKPDRNALRRLL